jgi:hypothetical protein
MAMPQPLELVAVAVDGDRVLLRFDLRAKVAEDRVVLQ